MTASAKKTGVLSMHDKSDAELVELARQQEHGAFRELVRRYQRPLFNGAYRITLNRSDAVDATQAAFVKAFAALDRFDVSRSFFSWIYRILINEALDINADRQRYSPYEEATDHRPSMQDPERDLDAQETSRLVQRALLQLTPAHRTVLWLRHYHGLPYRDMAEILELEEKTVKSRLFEARRQLRSVLKEDVTRGEGRPDRK